MNRNYEGYSNGVFSNGVVINYSNGKIFRQATIKKRTPNSTRVLVFIPNKCGDST